MIVAGAATLLSLNWVMPAFVKIAHRRAFLRRMGASDEVYLTFDDGPHPTSTPAILDVLAGHDVTASFFVVGANVERHPEIVERILDEGHVVGSHGYAHSHAWKTPPWSTAADLRQGVAALTAAAGPPGSVQFFRPPFGKLNIGSVGFLSRQTAWWDVDPRDYESDSGVEVFERLRPHVRPGAVILMHDGRLGDAGRIDVTVEAVRLLLEHGERQGLRFRSLPS